MSIISSLSSGATKSLKKPPLKLKFFIIDYIKQTTNIQFTYPLLKKEEVNDGQP